MVDNPLLLVIFILVGFGVSIGMLFGPVVQYYFMAGITLVGMIVYFDFQKHGGFPDDEDDY